MIDFKEAFGTKFGERVQGSGVEFKLSEVNPNLKGRALTVGIYDKGMNLINGFNMDLDGIFFETAESYYKRFAASFGWSLNARWRLWKLQRNHGGSYFPFAGFSDTIRHKAFPKPGRPLVHGELFYMTFTDEHGESATISATFAVPENYSGRAMIGRRVTRPKIMYRCGY